MLKDFSVDQKRVMVGNSKRRLAQFAADHGVDEEAAELLSALEEVARMATIGKWGDRWFRHPISDMREPEKSVCWLTDIDPPESDPVKLKHQRDHHALLHLKATVTAVDRFFSFFMRVRRGLTLAEWGIVSASAERRLWFGKNAYHPAVLVKMLSIFRTYFNYCEVAQDGKTPAMRLGLTKGPIALEDIVYFSPEQPARRRARQAAPVVSDSGGSVRACTSNKSPSLPKQEGLESQQQSA